MTIERFHMLAPHVTQFQAPDPQQRRWRARKPWRWLPRLGAWLERRAWAKWVRQSEESLHVDFSYTTVTIDTEELLEAVFRQNQAISRIYHGDCSVVIIGRDEWCRLAREADCHPATFDVRARLAGPNGARVFGLQVVVVPWFEGICVLPKEVIVRSK